jgi:hypothetical protein
MMRLSEQLDTLQSHIDRCPVCAGSDGNESQLTLCAVGFGLLASACHVAGDSAREEVARRKTC